MTHSIAHEDVGRIRLIMEALAVRDEKTLSTLIDENREDMQKVWEFIDSLYFAIVTPTADFEQWTEIYPAVGGLGVDARFPTADGEPSDLVVMLDIVSTVQPHKFILKGIVT
jgi:hypothetical protein